jgi:serine/threonine protein kinase
MSRVQKGSIFRGEVGEYRLRKVLGDGGSGIAWKASVTKVFRGKKSTLSVGEYVVIKFPKLNPNVAVPAVLERWERLAPKVVAESMTSRALRRLRCIAHVIDLVPFRAEAGPISVPLPLIVEEFLPGRTLDNVMEGKYHHNFHGVRTAREFFDWARKLVDLISRVHSAQIVHGDIWEANIMSHRGRLALIDFGEGQFRDLVLRPTRREGGSWTPPEGNGTVAADIYAIGGTLFYLATGRKEPMQWKKDIDELKSFVAQELSKKNPTLHKENWGIADIIASCLRYRPEQRPRNTQRLRLNIETFDEGWKTRRKTTARLAQHTGDLFGWLASCRQRQLSDELKDMRRGVFDLMGDHDDLVLGMTQFISVLDAGDEYLTVTAPSLWRAGNLGIMGRFLSMNRLAAQRRAILRRVFLICPGDKRDPDFGRILSAHIEMMRSLPKYAKAENWQLERRGFYAGVIETSEEERQNMIVAGDHCGVLTKESDGVLMAPVYDASGMLVSIQMRRNPRLVAQYRSKILTLLKRSRPLADYFYPGAAASLGAGI